MRILVQRYSALGDIAMLLPILQKLQEEHPEHQFALCSRPYLRPLAEGIGLKFIAADLNGKHQGFGGLMKLSRDIKRQFKPDIVIDAHAVLRSKVIDTFFRLSGKPVYTLTKDRARRKKFLELKNPAQFTLKRISDLHLETFRRAGLNSTFDFNRIPRAPFAFTAEHQKWWHNHSAKVNIGIAPGARHRSKQWPAERFSEFMQGATRSEKNWQFLLFGGPDEKELLEEIGQQSGARFINLAGRFKLDQEIALMKNLDLMISHDSSNMHLAAWSGTPVISIWGGTHPGAGFAPYGNEEHILSVPEGSLDCRPCSIYGSSSCERGDWACLDRISVSTLKKAVNALLKDSN